MLLTTNFSESKFGILRDYFSVGDQTDFSQQWYEKIGPILVRTMLFSSFMPIVSFVISLIITKLKRFWDRGLTTDIFKSRKQSISDHFEYYVGPEFDIEFRWSDILTGTSVALIFGPTFPLLYPVTLLQFAIRYVFERLLICYWCREPPAYDDRMAVLAIRLMRIFPLATLVVSFWQLGNRQIFDNFALPIINQNSVKKSGHYLK